MKWREPLAITLLVALILLYLSFATKVKLEAFSVPTYELDLYNSMKTLSAGNTPIQGTLVANSTGTAQQHIYDISGTWYQIFVWRNSRIDYVSSDEYAIHFDDGSLMGKLRRLSGNNYEFTGNGFARPIGFTAFSDGELQSDQGGIFLRDREKDYGPPSGTWVLNTGEFITFVQGRVYYKPDEAIATVGKAYLESSTPNAWRFENPSSSMEDIFTDKFTYRRPNLWGTYFTRQALSVMILHVRDGHPVWMNFYSSTPFAMVGDGLEGLWVDPFGQEIRLNNGRITWEKSSSPRANTSRYLMDTRSFIYLPTMTKNIPYLFLFSDDQGYQAYLLSKDKLAFNTPSDNGDNVWTKIS